jgi:hypothetical protein
MRKHLTLVFDVENLTTQEIESLTSQDIVRYMAWGHIPYERDELLGALKDFVMEYGEWGLNDKARSAIARSTGE